MTAPLLSQRDLDFALYELFDAEALTSRERFADHSRETFDGAIQTAKTIAERYFLPIRRDVDQFQPSFEGERVYVHPKLKEAVDAAIDAGLGSACADFEMGGMQLPEIIAAGTGLYTTAAGSVSMGYISLTNANCNLIQAHGSEEQIEKWVKPMREGRFAGTMAMTEPGAGSGLADLITTAVPQDDGSYRVTGNKIYISGGDHELNDNIVHLVLARVKGAPKGVKGISLFIVPKFLVNEDGSLGERNEVALSGLFHKMGGRGQTSTSLSFGDDKGAVGYLVGEENKGLAYMFHMMNEARIMVGTGAAALALAGYQYSLNYAKERPQGRLASCKDPSSPPVNIIEHADVKRMLLAQKAYAEGAVALCLYGSHLSDDVKTAPTQGEREEAQLLLDLLTPVVKTWPSEYGPKANSLAIQVLGGAGYIDEHPVEMFYRDNRLNPIHEGTTGIQSLDLLARKVPQHGMKGYQLLQKRMQRTLLEAGESEALSELGTQLEGALAELNETTQRLLETMGGGEVDLGLANSAVYLELFGHIVIAWLWLRQALVADNALNAGAHSDDQPFYEGKIAAARYFYRYELIHIRPWAELLRSLDDTCLNIDEAAF